MRKINLTRKAEKFLRGLPLKHAKQIGRKLMELRLNPMPNDASKLAGSDDYLRTDIGEYRIIYDFDAEVVNIVLIGKRNDDNVYKELKRLK